MSQNPLPKGWIFSSIKGVRKVDHRATYYLFDFESLPPVELTLDEHFDWLQPYPTRTSIEQHAYDFSEALEALKQEAQIKELSVPRSFHHFMGNAELISKIRSNTDCYFEMGNFIEEVPGTHGLHFIHFMSDSQGCGYWYLCIDKEGNNCVVTSGNLYSHAGVAEKFGEIGYLCAPSFEEFIFRFWIENEIWFKTIWDQVELNDLEKRYVAFLQKSAEK